MRLLLVRHKCNRFSLYCPDVYGMHTWGTNDQDGISHKRKYWYIEHWSAGNDWIDDTFYSYKLNVVLEANDIDTIINYVKEHNSKELYNIIEEASNIFADYFAFLKWVYKR